MEATMKAITNNKRDINLTSMKNRRAAPRERTEEEAHSKEGEAAACMEEEQPPRVGEAKGLAKQ